MVELSKKQLEFARGLLRGERPCDAYRGAGYAPSVYCANKLAEHPKVVAYLTEQRQQASEAVQVDLRWWLERNVAEALGKVEGVHITKDGAQVEGPDCTPASRAAALDRIGKHLGAYKGEAPNPLGEATIEDLLRRLPEALSALGYRLVPKDANVVDSDG